MTRSRSTTAALVLLMLAAGAVYAAGIPLGLIHDYYGPAVFSMSRSWSAFFWGAFDPAQTITMDKLPLAFQLQALSARVFGYSDWSVLMPQVLAAVATVGVLFATVRRVVGERAGLLAAAAYAVTPIVAALAHSQIVDTLLTFFLVCAAYLWTRAVQSGRLGWLAATGVFVGLAFNVKMVQAWGVLPALALGYLLAAPGSVGRRLGRLVVAGLVTAAASLWWVVIATLVPAGSRPWIDGSSGNSAWEMVFGYNLFDRYSESASGGGPGAVPGATGGWDYLIGADVATQVGWLYPLALVGLVLALVLRRGMPRTDLVRAAALMWTVWVATFAVAFSAGRVAHSFYVVALAPALAALAGTGFVLGWGAWRAGRPAGWWLPVGILATVVWTVQLQRSFAEFATWVVPVVVGLAAVGLGALVLLRSPSRSRRRPLVVTTAAALVASILAAPLVWTASTTQKSWSGIAIGPAAGPVQSMGGMPGGPGGGAGSALGGRGGAPDGPPPGGMAQPPTGALPGGSAPSGGSPGGGRGVGGHAESGSGATLLTWVRADGAGTAYDIVVVGYRSAGSLISAGGRVISIGGFTGSMPNVTADRLAELVKSGQVRHILLGGGGPGSGGPGGGQGGPGGQQSGGATSWVTSHCTAVDDAPASGLYRCGSG